MTTAQITEEIEKINSRLEKITEESKELKKRKKSLEKDFVRAEEQEKEATAKRELEELQTLMSEKGLTVAELKDLIK